MNEGSPSKVYGMIMNPWCPTIHSNEASASELICVQKDLLAPITPGRRLPGFFFMGRLNILVYLAQPIFLKPMLVDS
jgi:hypothetical protein